MQDLATIKKRNFWNQLQYRANSKKGHYESYFFRANHPSKPLAFWVRYTIFSPKGKNKSELGELWAIFFDGERNIVSTAKQEYPLTQCQFSKSCLDIEFPQASASNGCLNGSVSQPNSLSWNLNYESEQTPLLLLPEKLYKAPLPKAKAVVGAPLATFNGKFVVNGETHSVENWLGSENHNWGEKHTDQYAWGQVSGFDDQEDIFLEAISGKVKIGPFLSPLFSILVLRIKGQDFRFNKLSQAFKAKAHYDFFEWYFKSNNGEAEIEATIKAPREHFTALTYYNPPGGDHTCLNSKIASCVLSIKEINKPEIKLESKNKAAFEILTDRTDHQLQRVV
jgi:hypothetical protein